MASTVAQARRVCMGDVTTATRFHRCRNARAREAHGLIAGGVHRVDPLDLAAGGRRGRSARVGRRPMTRPFSRSVDRTMLTTSGSTGRRARGHDASQRVDQDLRWHQSMGIDRIREHEDGVDAVEIHAVIPDERRRERAGRSVTRCRPPQRASSARSRRRAA